MIVQFVYITVDQVEHGMLEIVQASLQNGKP
jgi:hypothetical protein